MILSASSAWGPKAPSSINPRPWENIRKMLDYICLLLWHFKMMPNWWWIIGDWQIIVNSCWTWLSHSLVIFARHVLVITWHKYTLRWLWSDVILSVVVPPYGLNIWHKSCCTFTVRISGSTGSVSNTPEHLKSTYLLDFRRQPAMLIHEHSWDSTQPICE